MLPHQGRRRCLSMCVWWIRGRRRPKVGDELHPRAPLQRPASGTQVRDASMAARCRVCREQAAARPRRSRSEFLTHVLMAGFQGKVAYCSAHAYGPSHGSNAPPWPRPWRVRQCTTAATVRHTRTDVTRTSHGHGSCTWSCELWHSVPKIVRRSSV